MRDILINGVTVKFPYDPYPIQLNYMRKVIECLVKSQNAMLESPTGTGKTVCLLSATLAWVEHNKVEGMKSPTVIYSSRTHSQLQQVSKEFKRYQYKLKAATIGSRDQLCIHPDIKEIPNADKSLKCMELRSKDKCDAYTNWKSKPPSEIQNEVMDIEDLVRAGMKHKCCPYYMARESSKDAEIIFMPYNYLIDPKLRGMVPDLNGSIIILDEAHNIQNVCENAASSSIKSTEILAAARDMQFIVGKFNEAICKSHGLEADKVHGLKASFEKLVKVINGIRLEHKGGNQYGAKRYGGFIFTLLRKANISESDILVIEKLVEIFFANKQKNTPKGTGLRTMLSFLQVVFSSSASELKNRIGSCYRIYFESEVEPRCTVKKHQPKYIREFDAQNKILNFWCFSPAFGIQNIVGQGIRSLILTSGTLSPFQPIIKEMDIPMPIKLSNPHVIKHYQVYAKICSSGVNGVAFNGRWYNRDNRSYINSLGQSIAEVAKVVPGGLLVFFKSYAIMQKHTDSWKSNSIWARIRGQKPIFVEPQNKQELKPMIRAYSASANQNRGAIFMAVLKGKVSEGLDFADANGRAVIVIGIPYGPVCHPKVLLKRECLTQNRVFDKELSSGDDWYRLEAVRAINQAIGRVIRHKNDFGAILLFDNGYSDNVRTHLSKWIKNHLQSGSNIHRTIADLKEFFENPNLPRPMPWQEPIDFIDYDESDVFPSFQQSTQLMDDASDDDDGWLSDDPDDLHNESWDNGFSALDIPEMTLGMPQVALHERKRKPSASLSTINSVKMSEKSSNLGNSIYTDESKRKKMSGTFNLDMNMNVCEQNGLNDMESKMPPFVKDDLGSLKFNQLLQAFGKYVIDGDYDSCSETLFNLYAGDHLFDLIKALTILTNFLKPEHRASFEKAVRRKFQAVKI